MLDRLRANVTVSAAPDRPVPGLARLLVAALTLATVLLGAQAWARTHHAGRSAAAAAVHALDARTLAIAACAAAGALAIASRPKRSFRHLLLGAALGGAALAATSGRPALVALSAAAVVTTVVGRSLWTQIGDSRSSAGGWGLVGTGLTLAGWLMLLHHPGRRFLIVVISVAVVAALALIAGLALLARNPPMPQQRDLDAARAAVNRFATSAVAPFALMADKSHFWSSDGRAFIAFAVRRRVAVALGPAIGPPESARLAHEQFRQECRRRGFRPAFYQVDAAALPSLGPGHALRIGDEAVVDLANFSLEGSAMAKVRHEVARARRAGVVVEVVEDAAVDPAVAAEIQALSARIGRGRLGEMRFSVGARSDAPRLPAMVGLARDADGRLVAYSTWLRLRAARTVVLDQLRRAPDAPGGTMDLMLYTVFQHAGSTTASLGLAADADLARRFGGLVPRGLQTFKARFRPAWQARHLFVERRRDLPAVALVLLLLHFPGLLGLPSPGWPRRGRQFQPSRAAGRD